MPFNNFSKYPNKIFVETGSYYGDGIQSALYAGFKSIFSIEITEKYYNHCLNKFRNRAEVHMILGDSSKKLSEVIMSINEPITFYLDGHWDITDEENRGELDFPLCKELEIIAQHPIKNHTLIIDDVRLFDTSWKIGSENVIKRILEINPDYNIHYEDGLAGRKNDVLIAQVINE